MNNEELTKYTNNQPETIYGNKIMAMTELNDNLEFLVSFLLLSFM